MGLLDLLGITVDRPPVDEYHDSRSTLASLRIATELQGLYSVGDRGAAAIPATYRGAQLLTDNAAAIGWGAVRGGGTGAGQATLRAPIAVDPMPMLLVDPSPFMDRDEAVRMIVGSLIWRGNAYLYLQNHDSEGRPRFATPVNPDEVTVVWDADMIRPEYTWRSRRMVAGFDLLHIAMPRLPGDPKGLGPIDAERATLHGLVSANDYARALFTDSAVPSGYLKHPGKLIREEALELRAVWDETHQGGRGTGVLSGGITFETISMTPEQAQFLLTRSFGIQEVARMLGIPAHLLNAGTPPQSANSLTYTNVQSVRAELASLTLYPTYLRRIETAYSQLLPRGTSVRFDLTEFLKADDQTRFTAAEIAIRAGIKTVDEVRGEEGLPPLAPPAPTADPTPAPAALVEEVPADA